MREFNVTGNCVKNKHYMVDISEKLKKIKAMVDKERYFTINRARQYGKTTTLYLLQEALKSEYICIKTSFEDAGDNMFSSEQDFCKALLKRLDDATQEIYPGANIIWSNDEVTDFTKLGRRITNICKDNKVVLLIDEVDKSSNNRIFLHFLGLLRAKFLERNGNNTPTFHSVILAGVHDVKNIKQKMITAGTHTQSSGEGIYNSPWNIAAKFNVDMSFSAQEIETMLLDYESEHSLGMNKTEIAQEIYDYTSGYPFLVTRLCKIIDEELEQDWSRKGVQEAVKILLEESNTLFDDLHKNLENNEELSKLMYGLIIIGGRVSFNWANPIISLGNMYGFIEKRDNKAVVSNKIFEIYITEYFISKEETEKIGKTPTEVEDVVNGKQFDMETCIRKFAQHYYEVYNKKDIEFLERHGRLLFLYHLKPLINGVGFYHFETETRNSRNMDIVVDYNQQQFIIELKIWRGEEYKKKGYEQLLDYMSAKNAKEGYLITFDFRKETNKERWEKWVEFDDGRRVFDVMV